jgi:hypothetical protein
MNLLQPEPATGEIIARIHGGVTFSGAGDDVFMVYCSVVDNTDEYSVSPFSRVIALDTERRRAFRFRMIWKESPYAFNTSTSSSRLKL